MSNNPISEAEVQKFRAETRGTAIRMHFNNAGAALPPDVMVDTVVHYLQEEACYGGYETEAKYSEQLGHVYTLIAQLINASVEEVAIVENASTGWGLVFNGLSFEPGDEVITSEMEYVSNLLGMLNAKKKYGIVIRVIPNDEHGNFQLPALEAAINDRTKLIAITHIASSTGGMMPIAAIGKIAREHNVLYLVDACQTVGHAPIDVQEIHCDMLAVTGRKFLRGPRGTGFLYVRKAIQDRLSLQILDGHTADLTSPSEFIVRNDARRFELYEKNRALILGLGKAVEYLLAIGVDRVWERIQKLSGLLRSKLGAIPGVTVHDYGDLLSGIVTFSVSGMDGIEVKRRLEEKGVNVSVAKAVSTLIFMNKHHLQNNVRASVHYYNTEAEIAELCAEISALQQGLSASPR